MRGTASGRATMASAEDECRADLASRWQPAMGSRSRCSRRFGQVRRVHGILGAMQKRAEAFDEGAR